jgi:hypothetical protein
MSIADPQFSLSEQTDLFKINYYKRSANMYNSDNVLAGRIKKKYDFTGKQRFVSTPLSFSGGVGSGKLPKANSGNYDGAIITAKKVYATCEIEREAIYAAKNDKGAFVRATAETVKKTVESYMRNTSRILFGDGTAVLGRGDASTNVSGAGSVASPYVVTISAASWKEANWEERDYVQFVDGLGTYPDNSGGSAEGGTSETNLLEIVEVDVANKQISLVGTSSELSALSGSGPLPADEGLCMQKSYNSEPTGLKSVYDFGVAASSANSLYNISYQRRWTPFVYDASSAGVTPDLLNYMMLQVKKKSGVSPTMIMCGFEQYQNILAFLEDQKVYNLPNKNLKGAPGFEGIEYLSNGKRIGIFIDRFCDEDKIYFLNDSRIECHHRPGFGWFEDDGTVFLRLADDDAYGARYGGYYENFITPTGHGFLYGLATS